MEKESSDAQLNTLGHYFSENLRSLLAVGGKQRDNGSPGPITATQIQRETGVARSTLRALKSPRSKAAANPDLDTLDRIAGALGVPPAFLLMRPQDWLALGHAVNALGDYLVASTKLHRDGQMGFRSPVEKVLRECKVHPDTRPLGVGASPEIKRLNARDEWRRRHCLKLGVLMLRQIQSEEPHIALAAIAGAMVSQNTPHDPIVHD